MDLGCGLLGDQNSTSALHTDRAFQFIPTKHPRSGMHQDQVRNWGPPIQDPGDLEWRFTISVVQYCPAISSRECQIHPCVPSDFRERNTHISVFEEEFLTNPMDDLVHAIASFQVGKDER